MELELHLFKENCPECGGDHVVALHKEEYSEKKCEWYTAACGKICLDCGWGKELDGRQAFGFYTGRNCELYAVELSQRRWERRAALIVQHMKERGEDYDVLGKLHLLQRLRKEEREARAQEEAQERAEEARRRQERERLQAEQARQSKEEQERQCRIDEAKELFKAAYSRSQNKNLSAAEHNLCIEEYKQCLTYYPEPNIVYGNLMYHHNCLKQYKESVRWAEKLQQPIPKYAMKNAGNAYKELGDWASAECWYKMALDAGAAGLEYTLGHLCMKQGKVQEWTRYFLCDDCDKQKSLYSLSDYANQRGENLLSLQYACQLLEHEAVRGIQNGYTAAKGEQWLLAAEKNGYTELAEKMLGFLPNVRTKRERIREEKEKKDEEDELLLLLLS